MITDMDPLRVTCSIVCGSFSSAITDIPSVNQLGKITVLFFELDIALVLESMYIRKGKILADICWIKFVSILAEMVQRRLNPRVELGGKQVV